MAQKPLPMKNPGKAAAIACIALCFSATTTVWAQGQNMNWYFGTNAGLSFTSTPPTALTDGMLNSYESCCVVSDASANLLFYTDGLTIWNKSHAVMANGSGLLGDPSAAQSGLIIKQPGNANIYYVFTVDEKGGSKGLNYSVVNMSMAAGQGSVTVKNTLLYTPSTERLTAVRHCNGVDIWIISHDYLSDIFRCYLLTATGVSSTPVLSATGSVHGQIFAAVGCLKASPNGKKIGLSSYLQPSTFELFDFDNTTGVVSNSLSLGNFTFYPSGVEFSPDGSKFYGCGSNEPQLHQWDLCAGSHSAILASHTVIPSSGLGHMSLGPDGKIYAAIFGASYLAVVNNPNAAGTGCNFVNNGQSIAPKTSQYGLPNTLARLMPPPFTYSGSCSSYSFAMPPAPGMTVTGCSSAGFSLTGAQWNFGDPASGAANLSTLHNPIHKFSGPGSYTAQLVLSWSCGGGTDTIRQVVHLTGVPSLSVSGKTTICKGNSTTLTVTGAHTYSWSTGAATGSVAVNPIASTVYTVTGVDSTNSCATSGTVSITVEPCLGNNDPGSIPALHLFPNPATEFINIGHTGQGIVEISDGLGVVVKRINSGADQPKIDIRGLNAGIYFIKVSAGGFAAMTRFVKVD